MGNQRFLVFLQPRKAYLVLEDGQKFEGYSFGKERSKAGEVVFNTGLTGSVIHTHTVCVKIQNRKRCHPRRKKNL